jgi:hypothetical protein
LFDQTVGLPAVSTLHALDGQVTSNMAIVPAPAGTIGYDVSSPTALILDITAYFGSSALAVTTTSLNAAYATIPYIAQLNGQGGVPPYTWTATGLPASGNLTLNKTTGVISGTPSTADLAGSPYTVNVTLTDSTGFSVTVPLMLTINPLNPLQITTTNLADAKVGVAYDECVSATGGVIPYNWQLINGALPAGLTLTTTTTIGLGTCSDPNVANGAAEIKGTPLSAGTSGFQLQVSDSRTPPSKSSSTFSIVVGP